MKLLIILPVFFLAACNQPDTVQKEVGNVNNSTNSGKLTDTLRAATEPIVGRGEKDTSVVQKIDTAGLISRSEEILGFIKNTNYEKFAMAIHPQTHIRFSPYAYIDTVKNKILSPDDFLQLVKQNKKIDWNSGWEKPERLTVAEYFKKYVYDVDFLKAKIKSVNQYHSQGTDLNNIKEVYAGYNVVEFFFPGFEKKYDGLDFRALRMVYKTKGDKLFLIGIVHDEWTP